MSTHLPRVAKVTSSNSVSNSPDPSTAPIASARRPSNPNAQAANAARGINSKTNQTLLSRVAKPAEVGALIGKMESSGRFDRKEVKLFKSLTDQLQSGRAKRVASPTPITSARRAELIASLNALKTKASGVDGCEKVGDICDVLIKILSSRSIPSPVPRQDPIEADRAHESEDDSAGRPVNDSPQAPEPNAVQPDNSREGDSSPEDSEDDRRPNGQPKPDVRMNAGSRSERDRVRELETNSENQRIEFSQSGAGKPGESANISGARLQVQYHKRLVSLASQPELKEFRAVYERTAGKEFDFRDLRGIEFWAGWSEHRPGGLRVENSQLELDRLQNTFAALSADQNNDHISLFREMIQGAKAAIDHKYPSTRQWRGNAVHSEKLKTGAGAVNKRTNQIKIGGVNTFEQKVEDFYKLTAEISAELGPAYLAARGSSVSGGGGEQSVVLAMAGILTATGWEQKKGKIEPGSDLFKTAMADLRILKTAVQGRNSAKAKEFAKLLEDAEITMIGLAEQAGAPVEHSQPTLTPAPEGPPPDLPSNQELPPSVTSDPYSFLARMKLRPIPQAQEAEHAAPIAPPPPTYDPPPPGASSPPPIEPPPPRPGSPESWFERQQPPTDVPPAPEQQAETSPLSYPPRPVPQSPEASRPLPPIPVTTSAPPPPPPVAPKTNAAQTDAPNTQSLVEQLQSVTLKPPPKETEKPPASTGDPLDNPLWKAMSKYREDIKGKDKDDDTTWVD